MTELYFQQCSISVTCRDLGIMAATLANRGVNPLTGKQAIRGEYVESVLSVMGTCGMYDYAGEWLYNVGMPAKSGVSGGVIAVLPGQLGIGVFSPPLGCAWQQRARHPSVPGVVAPFRSASVQPAARSAGSPSGSNSPAADLNSSRVRTAEKTAVLRRKVARLRLAVAGQSDIFHGGSGGA